MLILDLQQRIIMQVVFQWNTKKKQEFSKYLRKNMKAKITVKYGKISGNADHTVTATLLIRNDEKISFYQIKGRWQFLLNIRQVRAPDTYSLHF